MKLRPFQPEDKDGVIALIDRVLREYGDKVWLEGTDKDLLDIEGGYPDRGGAFIVLEKNGEILGTHAVAPIPQRPGVANFRRLYLCHTLRGARFGDLLMQWAIDWARENRYKRVEFWSDRRFSRGHRFFAKFQFQSTGEERQMNDSWEPYQELFFYREFNEPATPQD